MTDLSPAAQAVLDAWAEGEGGVYLEGDPERLAAALRAVAEQMSCYQSRKFLYSIADAMKLHAIAAELEKING